MSKHAQITQLCLIRRECWSRFLHADIPDNFLQINTMIFDMDGQVFSKFPKWQVCKIFTMSQKKKVWDEVDFLYADKHQDFVQVDFNILGIKVSYKVIISLLLGLIKLSQSTQSNKLAIPLQYLKEQVHLLQINIKVPISWHYSFWWKWLDLSKVPKIGCW